MIGNIASVSGNMKNLMQMMGLFGDSKLGDKCNQTNQNGGPENDEF